MPNYKDGLSVVTIAGAADKYLDASLAAVSGIAGEIVFVNTGVTGNALETARKYGSSIYDFQWQDDFSEAKNFAIEKATFRWILNVDTDEILCVNDKVKQILSEAMLDVSKPAYLLYQDNFYDEKTVKPNIVLRLFQNDPYMRFVNPVHECLSERVYKKWRGFPTPLIDLHLRHYGFLPQNVKGKHERNIRILRKWLHTDPDNIFASFKLGSTLFETDEKSEALSYFDKVYKTLERGHYRLDAPFVPAFAVIYLKALKHAGLDEKAGAFDRISQKWVEEFYRRHPEMRPGIPPV
jgi:glycosyltransferase involved in cell wall biosynthesis